MNVVDSSGWLEFFADGPNAAAFAKPIEATRTLVVPTISLYEVFKRILQLRGENDALRAAAAMEQGTVVNLDGALALAAAPLAIAHKLPMADALILATARKYHATLWTQDGDFQGLSDVRYFAKK
jgi:predicted nucleic acid-binding protein